MVDVEMPQLGETVTEGTITRWLKAQGDPVKEGEALFEVSTDKVDSEVPAPVEGTLTEILVQEGETAAVGAPLARISTDATSAGALAATSRSSQPPLAAPPAPAREAIPAPVTAPASSFPQDPTERAAIVTATETGGQAPHGTRLLSPSVRRILNAYQLDPATLAPTGSRGRLTLDDVMDVVADMPPPPQAIDVSSASEATGSPVAGALAPVLSSSGTTAVPFTPIRRRIAEHMVRSTMTSPHAWVSVDVDLSNVEAARTGAKDEFRRREGISLTFLPFIARATIDALAKFPLLNATMGHDELLVHPSVRLGIAVDLDFEGLVVVAVEAAEGKRLRTLARDIAGLAQAARLRRATPDQVTGSTFTISNVGSHGATNAMAIINQPEVGVLATGAVSRRPVAAPLPDGTDGIVVHPVVSISLSWDHRAVDGAYASGFVNAIKQVLETRDWTMELA